MFNIPAKTTIDPNNIPENIFNSPSCIDITIDGTIIVIPRRTYVVASLDFILSRKKIKEKV
jgi:hypothetical protein